MKYFELTCTAYLKKDIGFKDSFEIIRKYIAFCLSKDENFNKKHEENRYKYYCFGSFYKTEENGIYKKDNTYILTIRTIDESLTNLLEKTLRENINNPDFLVLSVQKRAIKKFFINELYSITPVIITTQKDRYWTYEESGEIMQFQKQLHDNLVKKYQSFYNEKLNEQQNFIQLLEFKNKKPQTIPFEKNNKKLRFFGNKIKIIPNEDEISQKLAFMALGCGLGEKNSFGGGFCLWN